MQIRNCCGRLLVFLSYWEVGRGGGGGGKAPVAPGARQQSKRLLLCSTGVEDGRAGVGPGTFEIILSPEAVASNLFALSADKGAVAMGSDTSVDISCTVQKPRSLGRIFVGSWHSLVRRGSGAERGAEGRGRRR
mmetsp:Transcript_15464/g.25770  ORF Transcript_15464/g.25770 Transcript_15464/m.25770 type:complete len:134 (-) Transcript_15464:336-737(-)